MLKLYWRTTQWLEFGQNDISRGDVGGNVDETRLTWVNDWHVNESSLLLFYFILYVWKFS
jgi:hypothetical protein